MPDPHDDLEAIRRLKARYFRFMDTKQWDAWGDVFTEDCHMQYGDSDEEVAEGRAAIVTLVSTALTGSSTSHHGHMPEIDLVGNDRATGIWAMEDLVIIGPMTLRGWGHYHEEYRRCSDGEWRISSLTLTRLHLDVQGAPPAG